MKRETSAEAYRIIEKNGLLSRRRKQVYDYLYVNGPCTAKQITSSLQKGDENSGGYTTRLSELRRMGALKEVGTTECPSTGHNVILWDVTGAIPVPFKKDKTKLEKSRSLLREAYSHLDDSDLRESIAIELGIRNESLD